MLKKLLSTLLLICLLLSGCNFSNRTDIPTDAKNAPQTTVSVHSQENKKDSAQVKSEILSTYFENFDSISKQKVNEPFLSWLEANYGGNILSEIHMLLFTGNFRQNDWYTLTGNTLFVLHDMFSGALDSKSLNYQPNIRQMGYSMDNETILNFVGDISLADNWRIMPRYDERGKGVAGILSERVIAEMRGVDIMLVNNEFTFSNRGQALDKLYTFRASPARVSIYQELGIDIVSLANNHAYDYGTEAFLDTMKTLSDADIPYIGGGTNIAEAMRPHYFIVNGRKISYVAATRAEKYIITPEAEENTPGVLRTYDSALFLQTIREARQNSDYVIAYVHWGTEDSNQIEDIQRTMGYEYINAGADIVIGAHAHVLQGIEFYQGKPIVYNLGNFIFNAVTTDTGMLKIHIKNDGVLSYEFLPCIQKDCYTETVEGSEKERILNFMRDISFNVTFDKNGYFLPAE